MAPQELSGILVALITPFTDDGSAVDEARLGEHINRLIDAGVHGLVPGGSTGEFTAMSVEERKQLVELSVKYAAGRVPVVAGTGALTTQEGVELAVHAAKAGAAAVMVVPPYYDPVSYEQLRTMLAEIHQASQLPIVYYNIPGASGLTLTPQQIGGLSDVGVKYMKDTSGNGPALTELLFDAELRNKVTTFNGWDTLTFYGIAAGAKGSVWGATNVIPELSMQLWDALAVKGDLPLARDLWSNKIFPVCKFLESHVSYAAAVKTGMELQGYKTGGTRKPFALLTGQARDDLAGILTAAGLKIVS